MLFKDASYSVGDKQINVYEAYSDNSEWKTCNIATLFATTSAYTGLRSFRCHNEKQCDKRDWRFLMRWRWGLICWGTWRYFVLWAFVIALEQPADFIFWELEKQNYAIRFETEGYSGISVHFNTRTGLSQPRTKRASGTMESLILKKIHKFLRFLLLFSAGM